MRSALSIFTPLSPLLQGPLGIFGPILLILLCLWMARGNRSPWFAKAVLLALLVLLLLIMFCYI